MMQQPDSTKLINQVYTMFSAQFELAVFHLRHMGKGDLGDRMHRLWYSIFYNDPRYTLRKGKLYLMGLNPGGSDDSGDYRAQGAGTMDFWLQAASSEANPYSAYVDGAWMAGRGKGSSPHQNNVRKLLHHLSACRDEETSTRNTFCANLCFFRTPDTKALAQYPPALVDCWWYHRLFLSIVQPEIIICNGNANASSAFSETYKRLAASHPIQSEKVNSRRYVKWFRATLGEGRGARSTLVAGVPHLSQPYASMDDILSAIDRIR